MTRTGALGAIVQPAVTFTEFEQISLDVRVAEIVTLEFVLDITNSTL